MSTAQSGCNPGDGRIGVNSAPAMQGWSGPTLLTPDSGLAFFPAAAANGDTTVIAWIAARDDTQDVCTAPFEARAMIVGGAVAAISPANVDSELPAAAVASDGTAAVVWQRGGLEAAVYEDPSRIRR